jgi:hypothetical protein
VPGKFVYVLESRQGRHSNYIQLRYSHVPSLTGFGTFSLPLPTTAVVGWAVVALRALRVLVARNFAVRDDWLLGGAGLPGLRAEFPV